MIVEQVPVERVRVVVVRRGPLVHRLLGARDVVRVELDQGDVLIAHQLGESARNRRLSGVAPAGDSDQIRLAESARGGNNVGHEQQTIGGCL